MHVLNENIVLLCYIRSIVFTIKKNMLQSQSKESEDDMLSDFIMWFVMGYPIKAKIKELLIFSVF